MSMTGNTTVAVHCAESCIKRATSAGCFWTELFCYCLRKPFAIYHLSLQEIQTNNFNSLWITKEPSFPQTDLSWTTANS